MNELQNLIMNSVKNPSYFKQLNINELIDDENIKDELLNILQIIVTNSTKQNNQLKNYIDDLNINLDNKINDINDNIKELSDKIIHLKVSLNSYNSKLESNKVIETVQTNSIKLSIVEKDLKLAQNKYDKLILENLFIPTLIGPKGTKFKNLKELINHNYEEIAKIHLEIEKINKNFEMYRQNQNNQDYFLAIKKLQDFVDQKLEIFENNIKYNFNKYKNNQLNIDKKNETIFDELKKENQQINDDMNNIKIKIEENFNKKFNNEHKIIESLIININQIKDFNKEFIKMHEKLEQDIDYQKLLIQKYIRYFELYKYRENFFLQKNIYNKEKEKEKEKEKKKKDKNKKIKEKRKKNLNLINKENINNTIKNQNELLFNEDIKNEMNNINFIRNNSFELNNLDKNDKFLFNFINDKKDNSNSIINTDNYLTINSDIIYNQNKEDKKILSSDNHKKIIQTYINNILNEENSINKNNDNNLNLELNLSKSNKYNEKSSKIKLKKANLFNYKNLRHLSINNDNDNAYKIENRNNLKNSNIFLQTNNIIFDDKKIFNNNSYDSKMKNDNLLLKKNISYSNVASNYYKIDNYKENKLNNINKGNTYNKENKKNKSFNNSEKQKLYNNNNNIINNKEEKSTQIYKLKVLNFDIFDNKNTTKEKKNDNNYYNTNIKIGNTSKSLPYKNQKNKLNIMYDFSSNDYAKIIEKNKIKRVKTLKKINISKKI